MVGKALQRLPMRLFRVSQCAQRCTARCAHVSPGPLRQARRGLVLSRHSTSLKEDHSGVGHFCHAPLSSQYRTKAMAPEVEDMLSTHPEIEVDIIIEGKPLNGDSEQARKLAKAINQDAVRAVREALRYEAMHEEGDADVGPSELSVVLCSDEHIALLNGEWRQKPEPTDVLSFPMEQDLGDGCPVRMLGDLVTSLDTAQRQADERGHTLRDECRILLVHGILHLLGFDHEIGAEESIAMAEAERYVLHSLQWKGQGLIELAGGDATPSVDSEAAVDPGSEAVVCSDSTSMASTSYDPDHALRPGAKDRRAVSQIKLICIDMDGTLLNSQSKILPSSVSALRAALEEGVMVCLATGKARPAAISALQSVGLAGEGLVVSSEGPGIFLQGLAVHGNNGRLLPGKNLPLRVVEQGFRFSREQNVPLAGFLGDTCVTLSLTDELEELHTRYYEPLARIAPSLEDILQGPPVKKLLFMTDPAVINSDLKPQWQDMLNGQGAELMQAVPNMLEIVPSGVNKRVGLDLLLEDLQLPREAVMAIGDGGNDLHIVSHAGIGVAMGNAVPEVKAAANVIVSNNDEDGVAEAIERFVL